MTPSESEISARISRASDVDCAKDSRWLPICATPVSRGLTADRGQADSEDPLRDSGPRRTTNRARRLPRAARRSVHRRDRVRLVGCGSGVRGAGMVGRGGHRRLPLQEQAISDRGAADVTAACQLRVRRRGPPDLREDDRAHRPRAGSWQRLVDREMREQPFAPHRTVKDQDRRAATESLQLIRQIGHV